MSQRSRSCLLALWLLGSGCWDFRALVCDGGEACRSAGGSDAATDGGDADGGVPVVNGPNPCPAIGPGSAPVTTGQSSFCFDGFQWLNPRPHGLHLKTVWARAVNDVWAGGDEGMLMHWNGSGWASHQGAVRGATAGFEPINAIQGLPDGGAWLVGGNFPAHAFIGGSWRGTGTESTPADRLAFATLLDGGDLVLAAANGGGLGALPFAMGVAGGLGGFPFSDGLAIDEAGVAVATVSETVGESGRCALVSRSNNVIADQCRAGPIAALGRGQFLLASERDGGLWVHRYAPGGPFFGPPLRFVAGGRANGLARADGGFLVAGDGVHHLTVDGGWEPWLSGGVELTAVAEHGSGFAAVGENGAYVIRNGPTEARAIVVAENWLALELSHETPGRVYLGSPLGGRVELSRLSSSVSVPAADVIDLWASPDGGAPFMLGSSGKLYSPAGTPLVPDPGAAARFNAFFGFSAAELWIAADDGVWLYSADSLTAQQGVPGSPSASFLRVHGAGGTLAFAGGLPDGSGLVALRRTDGAWSQRVGGRRFTGVWLFGPSDGYLVSEGGTVSVLRDGGLEQDHTAASVLLDVWGFSADDVWAVGDNGTILRKRGGVWTTHSAGTRHELRRVKGWVNPDGTKEVYIAGERGLVLRYVY